MNQENVVKYIEKNNIKWVQAHFNDLLGRLRVLHFPANRFTKDDLISKGFRFDGSSVGFRKVEKSDMIAIPDIKTFRMLPHEIGEAVVRVDLYDTDFNLYRADPRNILKQTIKMARSKGYDKIMFSPEMEFCCFDRSPDSEYKIQENASYFSPPPIDDAKAFRKKLSDIIIDSGYKVKYHHHEKGKYQHEIEIGNLETLDAADFCSYFKFVSCEVAQLYDFDVTFMPKPLSEEAGNGMHAHIVILNKEKNIFYDPYDEYNLSQTARYFIGGILQHSRGIAAFANPTLNSYKRLIPHFEAPIHIAWARYNRSSLIRIPAKKNVDIEVRNADPAANPYLFFSALIHAGLDGIKKKISYDPIQKNIYKMSEEELKKYDIKRLPTNLMEALEEFSNDKVLLDGIGRDAADLFIEYKTNEWHRYMGEITDLDYKFYFNC